MRIMSHVFGKVSGWKEMTENSFSSEIKTKSNQNKSKRGEKYKKRGGWSCAKRKIILVLTQKLSV